MLAGRDISCSKLAMGSTRVMATCAVGGQAAGTAAAMAALRKLTPRQFGEKHIQELRQQLLKDDCYIMGLKNNDPADLARFAKVSATSQKPGCPASNVINGYSRNIDDDVNEWISDGIDEKGEILTLKLKEKARVSQVRITFDPDLSEERCISVSKAFLEKEPKGPAKDLVRDYSITLLCNGKTVACTQITGNYQRLCVTDFKPVEADEVRVTILATNGSPDAKVFEVRVY